MFCLQALTTATCTSKLCLGFANFILNFFLVDFFIRWPALIRPAVTLPRNCLSLMRRLLISSESSGLRWTSFSGYTFALLYSSVGLFFLDRDALPFPFFFVRLGTSLAIGRQLYFPHHLRSFQFVGFDIFNGRWHITLRFGMHTNDFRFLCLFNRLFL